MATEGTLTGMSRPLAVLAACVLAVVPVAAAGCAEDDVNPNALAEAAEATREQGGVHMTMNGTMEIGGQKYPLTMTGDADLQDLRMRSKTEIGDGLPLIEQVMIGTVMYMKMEDFEESFGAEWVKFDLAKLGEEMGIDFEQFMQMSQTSPVQQLDYLRTAANLEEVGTETIAGVETTHYKGELDMRKYPDAVPEAERESARKSIEKLLEQGAAATYPVEVWVDADSLVRRQKMSMTQTKPLETKANFQIDYTDFGKRVDIEAPKGAKDVTDLVTKEAG
jgi:hypothetical protein